MLNFTFASGKPIGKAKDEGIDKVSDRDRDRDRVRDKMKWSEHCNVYGWLARIVFLKPGMRMFN